MHLQLAVTPAGHVVAVDANPDDSQLLAAGQQTDWDDRTAKRIARLFAASQAEGLFELAAKRTSRLGPSLTFWRDFAGRYLTERCHVPQIADAALDEISPPGTEELAEILMNVPPMPGAEYLGVGVLSDIWVDLDRWVLREAAQCAGGLSEFLKKHAPLWQQVGRVCLHLAENRRDPDSPFAFLATYAPRLTAGARVQYRPLSESLREYAGAKNKRALVNLLTPVQLAAQKSGLVKDLVESGDLYQPLAWTPHEAYRFLREIPLLEESGLLVRVPDWWHKRARPRVGVSIGEKKRSVFGAQAMLDFQVKLALGEEELNEAEWQELMSANEGLVLLKGQWVEVDREKLSEALDHWKALERQSQDGLSFVEGMRLLAGAPIGLTEDTTEEQYREWSFVDAGKWLGQVLRQMRDPENGLKVERISQLARRCASTRR